MQQPESRHRAQWLDKAQGQVQGEEKTGHLPQKQLQQTAGVSEHPRGPGKVLSSEEGGPKKAPKRWGGKKEREGKEKGGERGEGRTREERRGEGKLGKNRRKGREGTWRASQETTP